MRRGVFSLECNTRIIIELQQFSTSGPWANTVSSQGVGKQTNWVTLSESVTDLEKRVNALREKKRGQISYEEHMQWEIGVVGVKVPSLFKQNTQNLNTLQEALCI